MKQPLLSTKFMERKSYNIMFCMIVIKLTWRDDKSTNYWNSFSRPMSSLLQMQMYIAHRFIEEFAIFSR